MYSRHNGLKRITLGAAGGLAATFVMQALLTANKKWLPSTVPPMRQEPGAFMIEKAEEVLPNSVRQHIPQEVETAAARTLAAGYGLTFGVLYALLRPKGGSALVDGVLLGLANWATGYLGWLPATGLMPPIWRQKALQAITPMAQHVLYGMATVGTYNWLRKRV